MKILSDEDTTWDELMERLDALGSAHGCNFVALPHRYRNRSSPTEKCREFVGARVRRP